MIKVSFSNIFVRFSVFFLNPLNFKYKIAKKKYNLSVECVVLFMMRKFVRYLFFIALCFPLSLFFIHEHIETKSDEDLKNGLSKLHAVSHKDLNDVTSHVQKVGKQIEEKKRQSAIKSNLPMSSRFKNTVILGDSLSEAFLDYRLLPQNIVLASRGKRTDNCDTEIQSAISLSPDKVFLSFGMNDLLYCRGNAQRFINQYKKLVTTIQKQLPDTKIYINSIIPMNENGYATDNNMRKDKAFNTALKSMCKEMHITYISNDSLIDGSGDRYERDGMHPKYAFYPLWLSHMAETAGI